MQAASPSALEAALAQVWRPLERHLRLTQGFALLVCTVQSPRLVQPLKERVMAWGREHGRAWIDVVQLEPETFAEQSLSSLFSQIRATAASAGSGPPLAWIEAHRGSDEDWSTARQQFFSRLNERRSRLETELAGPLLLLLPAGAERDMARHAPDLWHVRGPVLPLVMESQPEPAAAQLHEALAAPARPAATAAMGPAEQDWRDQWRSVFGDTPIARVGARDQRLRSLSLTDALEAVDEMQSEGRLDAARQLAEELLTLAELRAQQGQSNLGEREAVLEALGSVAFAQGDWARAESGYRMSLDLSRQRVEAQHASPDALRGLSIALNNVGQVAMARGDLAQAERLYGESLMLCRQLLQQVDGAPEALRDLSIALDNLGQVASARGDLAQAESFYRESLTASRKLLAELGELPGNLRDLAVSLENVGLVAEAQGDWAQAERAHSESLALRHRLVSAWGGSPEALRDLSVSLASIGRVARSRGDWTQAESAYRESLALSRQLVERLGGTPETLDDLAHALTNLSQLPSADPAARDEALRIRETLAQTYPQVKRFAEALAALRASGEDNPLSAPDSSP